MTKTITIDGIEYKVEKSYSKNVSVNGGLVENTLLTPIREVKEETEFEVVIDHSLPMVKHSYTKYKATVYAYLCSLKSRPEPELNAAQEYKWVTLEELDKLAFSAGHRKLLESPIEDVFEKSLGLVKVSDCEIEINGFHAFRIRPKINLINCTFC